MKIIYEGVKAGNYDIDIKDFYDVLDDMFDKGAEAVVLACTELPLAFEKFNIDYPNVDPTEILAKAAVKFASED